MLPAVRILCMNTDQMFDSQPYNRSQTNAQYKAIYNGTLVKQIMNQLTQQSNIIISDTPQSPRESSEYTQMVNLNFPRQNLRSKYARCVSGKFNLVAHTIQSMGSLQYMEANYVVHPITGTVKEYRHLIKGKDKLIWERSFSNKLGQLAQGIRDINGTNTMAAIPEADIPKNKKVTYGKIVCALK